MSSSVRVSGINSNHEGPTQWLQQSQEILSVFGLGSVRPTLQEYVYILRLKHNDNSINGTNVNFSTDFLLFAEPFTFGGDTATHGTIPGPV